MTSSHIVFYAIVAALLFWIVGAYSRLLRLRAEVVRHFAPFEAQFVIRQRLLHRQLDALALVLASAGPRLDALRAACRQTEAACALATVRAVAPQLVDGLRVAEDLLTEARARLPVQGATGLDLAELHSQLGAVDATLAFARDQFNAAVEKYNDALRQFPTLLVARIFGLRPAGTL